MKSVIIIGGGKSISEGIEKGLWEKIKEKENWSVNFAFMTMPYLPSREIWIDPKFFDNNMTELQELHKKGVPLYTRTHGHYRNRPELTQISIYRELNKRRDEKIFVGGLGLSGNFALGLALEENYEEIYLLGADFGSDDENTHYYQGKLNVKSNGMGQPSVYKSKKGLHPAIKDYDYYAKIANEKKIKIYNVSMISRIESFPKITWEQFFEIIKEN